MNSAIILLQLVGAIVVVLLAWAFLSGLVESRSFKGAIESVKVMLKDIPAVLGSLAIAYIVIGFIGMFISE